VVFHIGSQRAAQISNTGGNQYVHGGQHASGPMSVVDARAALGRLREDIGQSRLPGQTGRWARAEIDAADTELTRTQPDKRAVAARLAQVLSAAGALAAAGTGLGGALTALASWLGTLGDPIRRALHTRKRGGRAKSINASCPHNHESSPHDQTGLMGDIVRTPPGHAPVLRHPAQER
jgi:hypothetical protein